MDDNFLVRESTNNKLVTGLKLEMKSLTLILLALCVYVHAATVENGIKVVDQPILFKFSVQGRNIVAETIYNLLNGFRDTVINGNDVLPPLDPLHIEQIGPFEYSTLAVNAFFNLNNFRVEGLRWYIIDHVTFNALRLSLGVQVTVPWIIFTGSYDASARIALISHSAGGNYRLFINRMENAVDIRVGTNLLGGGTLILRELDIRLSVNDVQIQIDGMVGSQVLNNLINTFVQNAAQNLLVNELETASQVLSRELFDAVNEFLGNFTLDDLLG